MSIQVNFIEGSKGSVCRNHSFSVVADDKTLIDIIPLEKLEARGINSAYLKQVFNKYVQETGTATQTARQALRAQAHLSLGLGS